MTPTRTDHAAGRSRARGTRTAALAIALGLAVVLSACGSSSSSASTTAAATTDAIVKPPAEILQGCSYAPDNKVPAGEPQGMNPPFSAFSSDQSAQSALQHIKDHGGTGLVYGFQLPSGTKLYAGPDSSSSAVGTLPVGRSILLFDPVIWTTSFGRHWLVSFLACGGTNPYWVDVSQIKQADAAVYSGIAKEITTLLASQDYASTGHASSLPVVVTAAGHFAWKDTQVPFSPARGEYVGYGV
jgi:hypothetical protein